MPCNAEFGIIENFDKNKEYGEEYAPQKYNCIAIDDDIINNWWPKLISMKSYFHNFSRPGTALARYGITLIPPESLDLFYDVVANDTEEAFIDQIYPLLKLIKKAEAENKFVIHYGV